MCPARSSLRGENTRVGTHSVGCAGGFLGCNVPESHPGKERDQLSWRMRAFAFVVRALRLPSRMAMVTAGTLGARHARFLTLRGKAERALKRGDHDRTAALARELLTLALHYRSDWNFGNAIHHGHLLLGRVAVARGDLRTASAELLEAGRTPGSPQLNTFGPNMALARELLEKGQTSPVQEYFSLCRRFWMPQFADAKLKEWESDVIAGREPRFGSHLAH